MKARLAILMMGALLLAPVANATDGPGMVDIQFPLTWLADVPGNEVTLMTADLEAMEPFVKGRGKLVSRLWIANNGDQRQSFKTVVGVAVPSKVPGFATLDDAIAADVRIRITSSSDNLPYAECMLTVEPVTARSFVSFSLDLLAIWDDVKPQKGICDIDLNAPGIQGGIPVLHGKDLITTFVRGKPYEEFEFLGGYCE